MKNIPIILLSISILFSCSPEKNNRTVLTGKIENLNGELYLEGSNSKFNGELTGDGDFKIVVNIIQSKYFKLKTNKSEVLLFLFPNDSININFDNNDWISSVEFSGNRTDELNYLLEYTKLYNSVADTLDIVKYYSLEPNEFLETVDTYKNLFLDRLNKNNKIDQKFKEFENQRVLYIWSWDKNTYPKNHLLYTKQTAQLPDNYFDYLNELELNNDELMKLMDYTDFLKTFVELKYYLIVEDENQKKYNQNLKTKLLFEIIDENFTSAQIKDYLLNSAIISQIENLAIDSIGLETFNRLCTNSGYKENVLDKYKNIKPLLKGQPAPKERIVSQNNEVISLNDFKGKYVFVDFWATYCAPCIREIPYLNQLEKEFTDNNVVFLGLCVDSKKEDWENILLNKKPAGIQVWLDKEQSEKIKKEFSITVQPTYVLIDREGNYINSRAPRPSENIREILSGLEGI